MSQFKQGLLLISISSAISTWMDFFIIKFGNWLPSRNFPYMGIISPIICLIVIFVLPKFKTIKFIHLPEDCKDKTTLLVIAIGFLLSIYPCVVMALDGVI